MQQFQHGNDKFVNRIQEGHAILPTRGLSCKCCIVTVTVEAVMSL